MTSLPVLKKPFTKTKFIYEIISKNNITFLFIMVMEPINFSFFSLFRIPTNIFYITHYVSEIHETNFIFFFNTHPNREIPLQAKTNVFCILSKSISKIT